MFLPHVGYGGIFATHAIDSVIAFVLRLVSHLFREPMKELRQRVVHVEHQAEPPDVWAFESVVATNDHRMREYRDLRESGPEPVAEDLRMALPELLRKAELNGELGLPRVGDGGH